MIDIDLVELKKLKVSHVTRDYLKWFEQKSVKKFIQFKPNSLTELRNDVKKKINTKHSILFGIFMKKRKHIGNIYIHNINRFKSSAYLGILIGDTNYLGKGVGYIAINNAINWLNKNFKINTIYLGVSLNNKPAFKLYKKIGFKILKKNKNSIIMIYNFIQNKFTLGTVQFGFPYGIKNNKKEIVKKKEFKKIFEYLKKINFNHLDSAEGYNFDVKILPKNFQWIIDTKIIINDENSSFEKIGKIINIYKKKNITLNTIYIHNPEMIFSKNGKKIIKILNYYKRKKFFKKLGVSIYDTGIMKKLLTDNFFMLDVIQIPYNIIDRRFEKYFKMLNKLKIDINVRSIFLQGLLLMKKPIFKSKSLKHFYNFSKRKKLKKLDLCVDFIKKNLHLNSIIFGVQSLKELREVINSNLISNVKYEKLLKKSEKNIIDPRKWTI